MNLEGLAQCSAKTTLISNNRFFQMLSPAAQKHLQDMQEKALVGPALDTAPSAEKPIKSPVTSVPAPSAVSKAGENINFQSHPVRMVEREIPLPQGSRIDQLTPEVQEIYQLLLRLALAHSREHRRKFLGTYCLLTSNELLMDALDLKKTTFYELLKELETSGLAHRRGWTSPIKNPTTGKPVCGGALWAIVVDPTSTRRARFTWWDWHGGVYRDMARVLTEKTSVHNFRCRSEQTLQSLEKEMKYQILETYTLSGVLNLDPVTPKSSVCPRDPKELIFALDSGKFLSPQDRPNWVEKMADQLATLMQDSSINLYRWILWRLIEASRNGRDYWQLVQNCLLSILGDQNDKISTNYGAVFVARLKRLGIWEELKFAWAEN